MLKVQIEARPMGSTGEWGVRSRLSDENYQYRDGQMSIEALISFAECARNRWLETDFTNELRIGVYSVLEDGREIDISTFANKRDATREKTARRGLRVVA